MGAIGIGHLTLTDLKTFGPFMPRYPPSGTKHEDSYILRTRRSYDVVSGPGQDTGRTEARYLHAILHGLLYL